MPSSSESGGTSWQESDLRPIGFFATRPLRRPFALAGRGFDIPGVEAVCSISECLSAWPENWVEHWRHNDLWVYDDLLTLTEITPTADRARFLRCSAAALPVLFDVDAVADLDLSTVAPQKTPPSFIRLGFDVCSRTGGSALECSPLFCNGMAKELPANPYGLFDRLQDALDATTRFATSGCGPGPYVVLEIRAERDPLAG